MTKYFFTFKLTPQFSLSRQKISSVRTISAFHFWTFFCPFFKSQNTFHFSRSLHNFSHVGKKNDQIFKKIKNFPSSCSVLSLSIKINIKLKLLKESK